MFELSYKEALDKWAQDINKWYSLDINGSELNQAYNVYTSGLDDDYIRVFIQNEEGKFISYLDTVDRERLAMTVVAIRERLYEMAASYSEEFETSDRMHSEHSL
jgi:hypothetical protein